MERGVPLSSLRVQRGWSGQNAQGCAPDPLIPLARGHIPGSWPGHNRFSWALNHVRGSSTREFPDSSLVRTEVQSLVRELRSYKLHGAARKKKKKKTSSSQEEEIMSSKALRRAFACRAVRPVLGVWGERRWSEKQLCGSPSCAMGICWRVLRKEMTWADIGPNN